MTTSPELKAEVLARMRELGPERAHTAAQIANHGERRSVTMVWRALEELWLDEELDQLSESTFRLARPRPARQATIDEEA